MSNKPAVYGAQDRTTGHGGFPPVGYQVPGIGCSPNVFIGGKNVHRVGDQTLPHFQRAPIPGADLHFDTISTGSLTVFVNNAPMAIIGRSELTSPYGPAGVVSSIGGEGVILGGG